MIVYVKMVCNNLITDGIILRWVVGNRPYKNKLNQINLIIEMFKIKALLFMSETTKRYTGHSAGVLAGVLEESN